MASWSVLVWYYTKREALFVCLYQTIVLFFFFLKIMLSVSTYDIRSLIELSALKKDQPCSTDLMKSVIWIEIQTLRCFWTWEDRWVKATSHRSSINNTFLWIRYKTWGWCVSDIEAQQIFLLLEIESQGCWFTLRVACGPAVPFVSDEVVVRVNWDNVVALQCAF